jgi:hypothetical protein
MEALARRHDPLPVLPVPVRIAGALGAALIIIAGVALAGRASEPAVVTAQAAITQGLPHIVLPSVEIVARRGDAVACTPQPARM